MDLCLQVGGGHECLSFWSAQSLPGLPQSYLEGKMFPSPGIVELTQISSKAFKIILDFLYSRQLELENESVRRSGIDLARSIKNLVARRNEELEGGGTKRSRIGGGELGFKGMHIICVDDSRASEKAMRFALENLPKTHKLLLLHGNYEGTITPPRRGEEFERPRTMDENRLIESKFLPICKEYGVSLGQALALCV